MALKIICFLCISVLCNRVAWSYHILDMMTHENLPIHTHTYYAIKNVETERYLQWFGGVNTTDEDLDENNKRFYHILTPINDTLYRMQHLSGFHQVKISQAFGEHNTLFHIYDISCGMYIEHYANKLNILQI